MFRYTLAEANSSVNEVVEQVSDIIETAGDKAGSFFTDLPLITTKLVMAGAIIFIGVLIIRLGKRMIRSIIKGRSQKSMNNPQQVNTLRSLVSSIYSYIMYFVIVTAVLSIFGVNISSLLALAGVGGVAISFGAQTLVKDVISGLFIWSEGSIAVGDIVDINGLQGEVESIAIRTTVVRNYNGNVYTIPNGDIRSITNMSRGFKRAIVDIRCPYEANQQHLVDIIKEEMEVAGREIAGLGDTPDVMSILSFDPDAVVVRVAVRCPVGENWRIEREIRSRVKARFDREGIVMPHYQKIPTA